MRGQLFKIEGPGADAFGRSRVSNPITLFDSKQLNDNQSLFWDDQEVSGTGTSSTFAGDTASSTLAVTASTAGRRVRQTKRRFNYQPGKSQQIFITFRLRPSTYADGTGNTRYVGIGDDNNGIFLMDDEGTINLVVRGSMSGSPVDTKVAQSSWNIDTMLSGNNRSRISIDWTKTQIMMIDYEWLGVGRVRVGFVIGGFIYYVHEFNHANVLGNVYMSTPNLPIRYELENDGNGEATNLMAICSTVISEGGQQQAGKTIRVSTAGTHLDANTENTIYAMIGLRLNSSYLDADVEIVDVQLQIHTTSDNLEWMLLLNPTVAGSFGYTQVTNSSVDRALGATANTVSGGLMVAGGYIASGGQVAGAGSLTAKINNTLRLGSQIDGTQDTIVLCVRPIGGSTDVDVEGGITWQERD